MAFLSTMTASTSQAHISDEQNIQTSPITIPEISSKIAASDDRQSTCTSKDGKTVSTIRNVIAALQHNMGLVMARLQSTDIQDYRLTLNSLTDLFFTSCRRAVIHHIFR
jgi:hypothetical protein